MPARSLFSLSTAALLLAAVLSTGCAAIDTYAPTLRTGGVYKLDINQGNYISQDMVDKLRVGQTRQQVKLVLGTPLIESVFRNDRWDYSYMFIRQGRTVEQFLGGEPLTPAIVGAAVVRVVLDRTLDDHRAFRLDVGGLAPLP